MATLTLFLTFIAAAVLLVTAYNIGYRLHAWAWDWKQAWQMGNRDLVMNNLDRLAVALLWLAAWGFTL